MWMNRKQEAEKIYELKNISKDEKIHRLRELVVDCQNELEAQDQNMSPEITNGVSEGLRKAKNYLRELENSDK